MRVTNRFFALLLTPVLLFAPLHAQAGAFAVDDSAVGAAGEVSLDLVAGVSVNRARERVFAATPAYTLQAIPLQLSLDLARDGLARGDDGPKRRFWGTSLSPEAKLRLVDLDANGRIGLAVATGLSWRASLQRPGPAEDEGEAPRFRRLESVYGLGIASFRLVEGVTLNLNAGVERDRVAGRTQPLWGLGATWQVFESESLGETSLIAEGFGSDRGRTGLQAGIRQTVHRGRIDLDLAVGRNLSDERATWLVFGVTGRF